MAYTDYLARQPRSSAEAALMGRDAADQESSFGSYTAPTRVAKPYDPTDDPTYKRSLMARKALFDTEQSYAKQLQDFDAIEGRDLKSDQKGINSAMTAFGKDPTTLKDQGALSPATKTMLDPNAPWVKNVGTAAQKPLAANYGAVVQKRKRLQDLADEARKARSEFDDTVFRPIHEKVQSQVLQSMGLGQSDSGDSAPEDVLSNDQPPTSVRSVSDPNFTQRSPARSPLGNPPVPATTPSDARFSSAGVKTPGIEESVPAPDVLAPENISARNAGLAKDWAASSPWDRVKMMFGSKGYGTTEVQEAKPIIGSEYAGLEGALYTIPKMEGKGAVSGVINAANAFSAGMTTPLNAALMATTGGAAAISRIGAGTTIAKVAQAAQTGALAGFTAQMGAALPEEIRRAKEVIDDPESSDADIAAAITSPILSAAMTALAAHGTVKDARAFMEKSPGPIPEYGAEPKFMPEGPWLSRTGPVDFLAPKPGTVQPVIKTRADIESRLAEIEKEQGPLETYDPTTNEFVPVRGRTVEEQQLLAQREAAPEIAAVKSAKPTETPARSAEAAPVEPAPEPVATAPVKAGGRTYAKDEAGQWTRDDGTVVTDSTTATMLDNQSKISTIAKDQGVTVEIDGREYTKRGEQWVRDDETVVDNPATATLLENQAKIQEISRAEKSTGEPTDATQVESPTAVDVRNSPADGEAVGSRNPVAQEAARTGQEAQAGQGAGLSRGEVAPAKFLGTQPGEGVVPNFDLFNLTADIPGHPKGSTVSRKTLEDAGYTVPDSLKLGDQPVKIKGVRERDGAEVEIEMTAKEAEKRLSDRQRVLEMIRDCLGRT